MELDARWHNPKDGALDLDAGRWRVLPDGHDSSLHVSLSRLSPGQLDLTLYYKRSFWPSWRKVSQERVQRRLTVKHVSSDACEIDLQLSAEDLGMVGSFAACTLLVKALWHDEQGGRDQAMRRIFLMPYRQFLVARVLRWCAFLPAVPLLFAIEAGEISGDLAVWYGALTLGLGFAAQEHPISLFSTFVREATRGVVSAVLVMGLLIMLQRSLLVRITNNAKEERTLMVSGVPLDWHQSRVTWSWLAPTSENNGAEGGGRPLLQVEAVRSEWSQLLLAPWRRLNLACRPFYPECERQNNDPAKCTPGRETVEAIELGPNCSIPPRVRTVLDSEIVLGRLAPKKPLAKPDALAGTPVCPGTYELALSEYRAYLGSEDARAQYARSFAMLVLPELHSLGDIALHWTNTTDESNGFVAAAVPPRKLGVHAAGCVTMIPVRNGSFEIELRGTGGGTLRCPSVGSCKTAYAIRRVFSVTQPEFDGMQYYSIDHGRSVWTPLGDSTGAFECDCSDDEEAPKQATLRLSRRAPQGLRLLFEAAALPPRIDISAGDQRSTLQCGLASVARMLGEPAPEGELPNLPAVSVQPLKLGYTDRAERVEVTRTNEISSDKWPSDWRWLEGEHQAWSCIDSSSELTLRVDGARVFDYQRRASGGDAPKLPVCYLHPSGKVEYRNDPNACKWGEASPEYAKLVRKDHVCVEVQACH